jgi:uncharacterized membrane protein HdeD (DUF308 family)
MITVDDLARHWWVVGLRGLAAIVFGILAIALPGMTLAVLILLFGAYALIDGILDIFHAFRGGASHRILLLVEGIVGVLAGLAAFFWPGLTALVLLYIIAFWAIVTGVLEIIEAIRLRRVISNEWALIIGGILSVLFGILLVAMPGTGALALVLIIGVYAIIFGIALLGLAWRLRAHSHGATSAPPYGGTVPA